MDQLMSICTGGVLCGFKKLMWSIPLFGAIGMTQVEKAVQTARNDLDTGGTLLKYASVIGMFVVAVLYIGSIKSDLEHEVNVRTASDARYDKAILAVDKASAARKNGIQELIDERYVRIQSKIAEVKVDYEKQLTHVDTESKGRYAVGMKWLSELKEKIEEDKQFHMRRLAAAVEEGAEDHRTMEKNWIAYGESRYAETLAVMSELSWKQDILWASNKKGDRFTSDDGDKIELAIAVQIEKQDKINEGIEKNVEEIAHTISDRMNGQDERITRLFQKLDDLDDRLDDKPGAYIPFKQPYNMPETQGLKYDD